MSLIPPNLPALSIRQPWAWLILNGGKNIENRSWPTKRRGQFLIHASKGCTAEEYAQACLDARVAGFTGSVPPLGSLPRGGIVGIVTIADCVLKSSSPWFSGQWGFVLKDPTPLPFTHCPGALGFFSPNLHAQP